MSSRNVVTDYTLLDRAMPYMHRKRRPSLLVILEGEGRFEERGKRSFLRQGDLVRSDARLGGTEAHAGAPSRCLALEWDPAVHGASFAHAYLVDRLTTRDLTRLTELAAALDRSDPAYAAALTLETLRAIGIPFHRVDPRALRAENAALQPLQAALSRRLSALEERPSMGDLESSLAWNSRRIHRTMKSLVDAYDFSWRNWREALHQARLLQASRLLAAPGASTELVARLSGFGAPAALCHAFTNAGWPSPGILARAARGDVLGTWSQLAEGI